MKISSSDTTTYARAMRYTNRIAVYQSELIKAFFNEKSEYMKSEHASPEECHTILFVSYQPHMIIYLVHVNTHLHKQNTLDRRGKKNQLIKKDSSKFVAFSYRSHFYLI